MSAGRGAGQGDEPSKARVVVLSGPSAVGKSTVVRCLRERVPDLHFSVSVTTRAPRPGEVDGVDYSFVTTERFQQLIGEGALLEWAEIHGGLHRSGTDFITSHLDVLAGVDFFTAEPRRRPGSPLSGEETPGSGTIEEVRRQAMVDEASWRHSARRRA